MTPRITIRDPRDAMVLLFALQEYAAHVNAGIRRQAELPDADRYALSLELIGNNQYFEKLITAIGDSIVPDTSTTEED